MAAVLTAIIIFHMAFYKGKVRGIEADECMEDALIREVLEETGLCVIRDSIQEYGQVHRVQKGTKEGYFECGGKLYENTQNDIV